MTILEGKGLTKRFGGLTATSDVDVHVTEGEILGLIGPNGAGKTTLFNLLSGALTPESGSVTFKGADITSLKPHEIVRKGIGRTFQSVKVFPRMSVLDNVRLGALFGATGAKRAREGWDREEEILEFTGLAGLSRYPASDLTLSNQKRLEVARALATRPDILLLDELMAGLTPTEVAHAMDLVEEIRRKGITIVMIEHVMKAIMAICDRIVVLHHGEKVAEGTPEEIARNRTVVEIYLGE